MSRPGVARTVKMSTPGALPVTTPQGTVPIDGARGRAKEASSAVGAGAGGDRGGVLDRRDLDHDGRAALLRLKTVG